MQKEQQYRSLEVTSGIGTAIRPARSTRQRENAAHDPSFSTESTQSGHERQLSAARGLARVRWKALLDSLSVLVPVMCLLHLLGPERQDGVLLKIWQNI